MDKRYDGEANESFMREKFIQDRMVIQFTTEDDDGEETVYELPAVYEVCSTCEGKGKHVHPDIDSHGISAQEFAEDPDFQESYFSGAYDVTCYECKGSNVVPEVDIKAITDMGTDEEKATLKLWREAWDEEISYRRECEAERRMGA